MIVLETVATLILVLLSPYIIAILFGAAAPFYARSLLNDPKNPKQFLAMFTEIDADQKKIVEWGGGFWKALLRSPDMVFRKWAASFEEGGVDKLRMPSRHHLDEWEAVPRPENCPPMPEVPPGTIFKGGACWLSPLYLFRYLVYFSTRLHFTGISPFMYVRVGRYKRGKIPSKEEASVTTTNEVEDNSDFFKIAIFSQYVLTGQLPTRQGWSIRALVVVDLSVLNGPATAYRVDRWDLQTENRANRGTRAAMQGKDLSEIYAASTGGDGEDRHDIELQIWWLLTGATKDELDAAEFSGKKTRPEVGYLMVHRVQVIDLDLDASSKAAAEKALSDPFVGEREGQRAQKRDEGIAEGLKAIIDRHVAAAGATTAEEKQRIAYAVITAEARKAFANTEGVKPTIITRDDDGQRLLADLEASNRDRGGAE